MNKKIISEFITPYNEKIRNRVEFLNNLIDEGVILKWYIDTYNTKRELVKIGRIVYAVEDGMTECYIITKEGKKYNVGSMILNEDLIYV